MLSFLKLDKLRKIQTDANNCLRLAIFNDRGRCWSKMAENYKKLLKLLATSNLPSSFVPPPSYNMLLYESYYHFGIALQNLGRHKESILVYTSALHSMNLRKNGCLAGCNSNTCFQTPVLARRGFAYAKSGDLKNAFKDVEKAVMLDAKNPDLYCVRAILWNMRKEQQKAIEDLNFALKLNSSHVGALLLRGTIDEPIQIGFRLLQGISLNAKKEIHKDHEIANKIDPNASCFNDVGDLHHPKMIEFWNRFLRCLNIPRTILNVDLTSAVIAQYNTTIQLIENAKVNTGTPSVKSTPATPIFGNRLNTATTPTDFKEPPRLLRPKSMPAAPFRCGTPHDSDRGENGQAVRSRRVSYGEAVRTYSAKRQETGVSEYILRLVEHASRPNTAKKQKSNIAKTPNIASRPPPPPSSVSRSSSRKSSALSKNKLTPMYSKPPSRLHAPTIHPPPQRRGSNISISSCPIPFNRCSPNQSSPTPSSNLLAPAEQHRRASVTGSFTTHQNAADFASKSHGIQVFKEIKIADVPRMYYKPWGGDKLPVAELPARPKIEAFRV